MKHIKIYENFILEAKEKEKYNKDNIKEFLGAPELVTFKYDLARIKALLWIYKFQTEDEKNTDSTNVFNGVGFTGIDGNILSSFAKQLKERKFLSEKQLQILRKKIYKYSKQMTNILNCIDKGLIQKDPEIDALAEEWIKRNSAKYNS